MRLWRSIWCDNKNYVGELSITRMIPSQRILTLLEFEIHFRIFQLFFVWLVQDRLRTLTHVFFTFFFFISQKSPNFVFKNVNDNFIFLWYSTASCLFFLVIINVRHVELFIIYWKPPHWWLWSWVDLFLCLAQQSTQKNECNRRSMNSNRISCLCNVELS